MKRNYLKFRFWDTNKNCFVEDYNYCGAVDDLFSEQEFNTLIPQQCTGVKDKNGLYIYEGDIVKFNVEGKVYTGIIQRNSFMQSNLDVVVQENTSSLTPVKVFSLNVLTESFVVSHIFNN